MKLLRNLTIGRVLVVTVIAGFSVLLFGGWHMFRNRAPIPGVTAAEDGTTLFTAEQIRGGQAVYQKYGLMDWGSVLGHGTYLGPDFTAETLHRRVELIRDGLAASAFGARWDTLDEAAKGSLEPAVVRTIKENRYDAGRDRLVLPAADAAAFRAIAEEVRTRFTKGEPDRALQSGLISEDHLPKGGRAWVAEGDQVVQLAAFFFWTSWLAGVERPGSETTFTNNWPPDAAAGNVMSGGAIAWSGVSVAALLLVLPIVLLAWFRGRYVFEDAYADGRFPSLDVRWMPVYPSQRKTIKYFVTAGALFLLQSLLGGVLAHYYVEGGGFFGLDISSVLPFNVAKTWHLQLAIFWIATAWLGMGLYVAPMIGGREPRRQGMLVDLLWAALVVVALGSLAGEWLGVKGLLGGFWWWLGHTGWELIELGKLWQILLAVGFGLWILAVWRGVAEALRKRNDPSGLVRLFLVSAIAIPLMFTASFLITPGSHLTMSDYWRWWVIHLWVEGMFEVFAVVVLGLLMVSMGLVTRSSAARALKFQLVLLLGSGIVGIGHHYYWIGAGDLWIGLGSVFSALEVVPLTLLAVEAVEQWLVLKRGGASFPWKHAFTFLVAVAFWNLFGAGVLGFLINLPAVSYFEHGSFLTANHGHAATMGVFGMLAIALALWCMRNVVKEDAWTGRLFTLSFWGLNVGLFGMVAITLTPVGVMQMLESIRSGFFAARSLEFYRRDAVNFLLWLRMIPDSVFILLGVVPLVAGMARGFFAMRSASPGPGVGEVERKIARRPEPARDLEPTGVS
jgi:nitric oxide reductase subunit B